MTVETPKVSIDCDSRARVQKVDICNNLNDSKAAVLTEFLKLDRFAAHKVGMAICCCTCIQRPAQCDRDPDRSRPVLIPDSEALASPD